MESKVYVGNLNWDATEENLTELFSKYGNVISAKIITDNFSGKSKGFGFIEMSSQEEAEKAISELNGTDFMERTLKVSVARPQRKRDNNFKKRFDNRY